MSVFVEGLVGIIVFYVLILVVGLYAGRKTKDNNTEEAILANRKFGLFVSSMTLTAAWYGGGYISGTAEAVATSFMGLAWVIAPWSYGISLAIGVIAEEMYTYLEGENLLPEEQKGCKRKSRGTKDQLLLLLLLLLLLFLFPSNLLRRLFGLPSLLSIKDFVFLPSGSFMFAKVIRKRNYITFIDAIQQRFGHLTGLIVLLISVLGSILYIASILLSLGATVSVVLDIGLIPSTIASVTIVVLYTFFGGLKSVAYTDIVQLPCIVIGLVLAIPFAISHPAVSDVIENSNRWTGEWQEERTAEWIDSFIILILGAIPVDVFLQRLLSAKTTKIANMSAVFSTCAVLALSLPPIFIGAIGANTDWSLTSYARHFGNVTNGTQASPPYSMTLPMVLQYLTPTWVAVISLGSVSAAVMSSMDSALIAVGSEMAINVYKPLLRPMAGGREIVWVIRVCVVLTAVISTVIALTADSIYSLFYIIGDLGGVILFPQFLCAVYLPSTNTYGSLFGFVAGIVLRLGGGDYFLKLPPFIKYPYYSDISGQLFPFKSFSALCTFLVVVFISYLTKFLFAKGILPQWMDFFRCFKSSYNLDAKNVEVSMDAKFDVKKQNTEADYTCANLGFQKHFNKQTIKSEDTSNGHPSDRLQNSPPATIKTNVRNVNAEPHQATPQGHEI